MPDASNRLLVFRTGPGRADVVRISRGDDGDWVEESRHIVEKGGCDCEGFKFKHTCSHLEAAAGVRGRPVTLDEARAVVSEVIAALGSGAGIPDEPYERGPDGSIVSVRVRLKCGAASKAVVTSTWKGVRVEVESS